MQPSLIKVEAVGALSMCMGIATARAASVTQPGEIVGVSDRRTSSGRIILGQYRRLWLW